MVPIVHKLRIGSAYYRPDGMHGMPLCGAQAQRVGVGVVGRWSQVTCTRCKDTQQWWKRKKRK